MPPRLYSFAFRLLLMMYAISGLGLAQGVQPAVIGPDGTLRLGPEVWLVILGAAVTIGINLQQLRSLRSDVKTHNTKFDTLVEKTLPDQYVRRDYWKEKIDNIESVLRRLERRV
jgi:hypothetical protein